MSDGTLSEVHRRNRMKNFVTLRGLLALAVLLFAVTIVRLDGG